MSSYELLEATAPSYAPAGDRGYQIRVARTGDYRQQGRAEVVTQTLELFGYVTTTAEGAVIATLDRSPWEYVDGAPAGMSGAELGDWIRGNGAAIVATVTA